MKLLKAFRSVLQCIDVGRARSAFLAVVRFLSRLVVPGLPRPVTQRGNGRAPVFFGDERFLARIERRTA